MTRLVVAFLLATATATAAPEIHQVKLNGHTFTLPKGFTIELAAKTPLVDRPIVAAFDDRGRLYVADSSGSNEKPDAQLKNPTHRIVRLEDTKGTGVFDKATVFADKMMFPEGILWHRGSVFVGAPPHIWKLTDTDDDGKADKRDVWFDGKTLTGCANDLHGPYLGPDGWIYWTKGAFAKQEYTLPNGKKFTTRAAHIFRARPDGTGIEPVMTGGMDNPVDVAFLPNGERFFTTTFFQHPAAGQRDGIVHAVYGGIYGKDHDVIYDKDHKWTSPTTMPVMTHLGPAAPCGLHCYESEVFGPSYKSNLFCCQFNLRKVSRHVLKPSGSTYTTEDSDFVVSDNQDFHPTDVIEDADGSLLIVDTGGWYKLCCPSSQLVKEDVLGAIYRVRRADAEKKLITVRPGSMEKLPTRSLIDLYGATGNGVMRSTVLDVLSERIDELPREKDLLMWALMTPSPAQGDGPVHLAVAILGRSNRPSARAKTRAFFSHPNQSAAVAAMRSAGLWEDSEAVPLMTGFLRSDSLLVRRAAAESLGRIGDDRAVEHLMKALGDEQNDRTLDHAIVYALIRLDNRPYLKTGLTSDNPRVRRGVLAALDQLGEKFEPKVVLEASRSKDLALRETALWILGRHPEWAGIVVGQLGNRLGGVGDEDAIRVLAKLGRTDAVQGYVADMVGGRSTKDAIRLSGMRVMASAGLKEMPSAWAKSLAEALDSSQPAILAEAVATGRAFQSAKSRAFDYDKALARLIETNAPLEVRLSALAIVSPGSVPGIDPSFFKELVTAVHHDQPPALRGLAAEAIGRAKLNPDQLTALTATLAKVGPLELDRTLTAFAQTKDEAIGLKLVAALDTPELRPSLRVDGVKERIKHFPMTVHKAAEKLYAALNAEYEQQRAKLDEMTKALSAGDVRRGQAVFNSAKASCIACHTIGYVGGKIGPDLTKIGGIRSERDLLEAILFPSASFVRSYEPLTVNLKDGRSFTGAPKKDAPDEIILVLAADKEQRIAREDIDEVRPGKVSIMPAGLDKQITQQELADLIAFLRACK
jgi:putative membrane-bound dehydrogenase-like protein